MGTLGRHLSRRCRTKARRLRSNVHAKPLPRLGKLIRSGDDARSHRSLIIARRGAHRVLCLVAHPYLRRGSSPTPISVPPITGGASAPLGAPALPSEERIPRILLEHLGRRVSPQPPPENPCALRFAFRLRFLLFRNPTRQKRRRPYYRARCIVPAIHDSPGTSPSKCCLPR